MSLTVKFVPLGKMTEHVNQNFDRRDLAEPINLVSINNSKYALVYVNNFTNLIGYILFFNKSDTNAATERFLADTSLYGSVKSLGCDNGGEFLNKNSMI